MAHSRKRHLNPLIDKALQLSPLVGILGHRQVGKTTLVSQIASDYFSFDEASHLEKALNDAASFVAALKESPTGLDECQLVPPLFPALKERVRKKTTPGQFLLSGSIRFTSRKAIRESLTGRILNFELLPFSIAELEGRDLPQGTRKCLSTNDFKRSHPFLNRPTKAALKTTSKNLELYQQAGGLPGVCFIRQDSFRSNKIQEQLLTMLDRDLRMVHATSLGYREILEFVQALARSEGKPINHSALHQETGVSAVSQKKLLYALEALFLIRMLPVEGGRKGQILFFEDQAESHFLSQGSLDPLVQFSGLLFRNLRSQWAYSMGSNHRFFHYLTPGGAQVPWAVQENGSVLGILPFQGSEPDRSAMATASSFLRAYEHSKILLVSQEWAEAAKPLDSRSLLVSASELLIS